MLKLRRVAIIVACGAIAAVSLVPPIAHAGAPGDKDVTYGGNDDRNIYAGASNITWDRSRNGKGDSTGLLSSTNMNWNPPPCWYAPLWTPKQFEKKVEDGFERTVKDSEQDNYAKRAVSMERDYYKKEEYKNYNISKKGEGKWWGAVENPNEEDPGKRSACSERPFWVDDEDEPEVEESIDPEILAGLAYEQIQVPDTSIEMNPAGRQTVNLNTWAWLDSSEFKPVAVTASLDELDISATTTATPVALRIQPGTKDSKRFPASGVCPINDDGSIGKPYTKGDSDKNPPCGLTYQRATSGNAPYKLTATITWEIEWTGTGDTGGELPNGTFGVEQEITVQEAQSVVR